MHPCDRWMMDDHPQSELTSKMSHLQSRGKNQAQHHQTMEAGPLNLGRL